MHSKNPLVITHLKRHNFPQNEGFLTLWFHDTFGAVLGPESVNQLVCLSMSSKHPPSALVLTTNFWMIVFPLRRRRS